MSDITWTRQTRKISDLRHYGRNARRLSKHDAKHLQTSLEKYGQCEPVVINADDLIIGGHQRVRTMRYMGNAEVDVYVPSRALSEEEVSELNIRLNRNAGEWDTEILANEWEPTDLIDWGFTEDELLGKEEPEKENKPKAPQISIAFACEQDLEDAEMKIESIVQLFDGAKMKVKR